MTIPRAPWDIKKWSETTGRVGRGMDFAMIGIGLFLLGVVVLTVIVLIDTV